MNKIQLEAALVAARPKDFSTRTDFTDAVMRNITSPEILSDHVRKMNVNKKETFIMKLKHLPKFAVIAIAVGALLLLSTGAYAAYQLLWPKPDIHVSEPTTSTSGRKEVSLLFSSCGDNIMPSRYELKRNATITEDQIEGVVKAQCELKAISEWAMKTYAQGEGGSFGVADKKPVPMVSMATHIRAKDASTITFAGLEKYNQTDTTLAVSNEVRYIASGADVQSTRITSEDPVVYVTLSSTVQTPKEECTTDACREYGEYHGVQKLVAVIKLDNPFANYDQFAWQSLTERTVCMGNEADLCLTGYSSSLDLYMNLNSSSVSIDQHILPKEIQGVITKINGASFTLKSSSGSMFTITTPTDVITDYNINRSGGYNNQKITVGSTLSVRYIEKEDEHSKTIDADKISGVTFKLEIISKGDKVEAY